MTLRDFISIIPKEYDDYIEGIEYDGSGIDFKVSLCIPIKDEFISYTCDLNLFSDNSYGIYNVKTFDLEENKESSTDYLSPEFIDVLHSLVVVWRSRDKNTC